MKILRPAFDSAPSVAAFSPSSIPGGGWPGPYFAVQNSGQRQPLGTFAEDTAKMVTPYTRTEIMLIARTLFANYGDARAVNTLVKIIGYLRPQARSTDEEWNDLAEAEFTRSTDSPLLFDLAQERGFAEWQTQLTLRRIVDCDFFTVLAHGPFGACIAGREAHLVKSETNPKTRWFDGVQTDANNASVAYRFIDPTRPDFAAILPASAVHHMVDRDTWGGKRGVSALAHACNNWRDIIETRSFMKHAIKMAAMIGLTRRQDVEHHKNIASMGAGSPTYSQPFVIPGAAIPTTAAEAADLPKAKFEDFIAAGIFSNVPLETLHDERPHPNVLEFQKDLLREVSRGIGVPPQILYCLDDPGGAWSRILLEVLAKFIVDQHVRLLVPACQRVWNFIIASAITSGRLREPKGHADYTKVRWTPPRSITADLGRIGRLQIEFLRSLMTTFAAHYEEYYGTDWQDELKQVSRERKFLRDLEKTDGHEPGTLTNALMPPGTQPQPDDEDENTADPPPKPADKKKSESAAD